MSSFRTFIYKMDCFIQIKKPQLLKIEKTSHTLGTDFYATKGVRTWVFASYQSWSGRLVTQLGRGRPKVCQVRVWRSKIFSLMQKRCRTTIRFSPQRETWRSMARRKSSLTPLVMPRVTVWCLRSATGRQKETTVRTAAQPRATWVGTNLPHS